MILIINTSVICENEKTLRNEQDLHLKLSHLHTQMFLTVPGSHDLYDFKYRVLLYIFAIIAR